MPHAEMKIFGSYPPTSGALYKALHRPSEGLHLLGFAPTLDAALRSSRVLLAPVRYVCTMQGSVPVYIKNQGLDYVSQSQSYPRIVLLI